jgi:N-formylglutamate amidohydrolase
MPKEIMPALPIAIINPHSGLAIPPELEGRIALNDAQIFNESDAYADRLYDFGDRVLYFETFPYARALLDVNRSVDGAEFRTGDGFLKTRTSYGADVYLPHAMPVEDLRQMLIMRYWQKWHSKLTRIASDERVKLVIDAHTMAAVGPAGYGDADALRARVLVGNYGDAQGEAIPNKRPPSAKPTHARFFVQALGEQLANVSPLTDVGANQALNVPYWGGYHLETYGGKRQPWLMVEVNRGLYIGAQEGNSPIIAPDKERIALIREGMWRAIEALVDEMGG